VTSGGGQWAVKFNKYFDAGLPRKKLDLIKQTNKPVIEIIPVDKIKSDHILN
jgi:hypothetical protein